MHTGSVFGAQGRASEERGWADENAVPCGR